MKKVMGVLLSQLLVLGVGGPAVAGTADDQRFLVAGRIEEPSISIIANGVINGTGSLAAESVDYRPDDRTYHETDVAVIGGGRLTISIDGAFDVWPFTLDPRTCTQRGRMAGTWTVTGGGGDFTGATGGGTFSGRFFTSAHRGPTGCDETAFEGFVVGPMIGTLNLGDTPAERRLEPVS